MIGIRPRARFRDSEDGTISVEYALWAPAILLTFIFIADLAFALTLNATMWHGSRDTARALSIHRINEEQAVPYLKERLIAPGRDYAFDVEVDARAVTVSVSIPFSDAGVTNTISRYIKGNFVARVMMYREPA
ncbi:TadE/TadG family type IV pilus assembly protein [Pseudoruegeria sp. HB172150]|uniref:TadE/TadG family type IV pilus assembly protein n=1 Tax=Pseudoruegeria sp. HB172150 TaxID=2721164 RepID=UPI001C12F930|nr:TadE family protein [Pseudoruegeria sp. HB172150]